MIINLRAVTDGSKGVRKYYNIITNSDSFVSRTDLVFLSHSRFFQLLWSFVNFKRAVWSPSHATSILSLNHIVTVHDLINLDCLGKSKVRFLLIYVNLLFVFLFCRKIVCISDFSKGQVLSYFPFFEYKIIVIKSPSCLPPPLMCEPLKPVGIKEGRPFFLMITNDLPHKNNAFVLNGLSRKAEEYDFSVVVVGVKLNSIIQEFSSDRLVFLDNISDDEIDWLYKNAFCVVSGSKVEGHNLVIAQAIGYNRRVICSDIPVHREFYDSFVDFFDPNSQSDFFSLIDSLFLERELADRNVSVKTRNFESVSSEYASLFGSMWFDSLK